MLLLNPSCIVVFTKINTGKHNMKSPTNLSIRVMVSYLIGFPLILTLPWLLVMMQRFVGELGSVCGVLLWISFLVSIPRWATQLMREAVAVLIFILSNKLGGST